MKHIDHAVICLEECQCSKTSRQAEISHSLRLINKSYESLELHGRYQTVKIDWKVCMYMELFYLSWIT